MLVNYKLGTYPYTLGFRVSFPINPADPSSLASSFFELCQFYAWNERVTKGRKATAAGVVKTTMMDQS